MKGSSKTNGLVLALVLSLIATEAGTALASQAGAPPDRSIDRDWLDDSDIDAGTELRTYQPHCDRSYPLHHVTSCGTMTGGPSGGLF